MRLSTALRLARPASSADRGRAVLIAAATASAGALLLAALHILRMPAGDSNRPFVGNGAGLADYVTQSGLRPGVVIAALLLTVPVFALAVQALRLGSIARDRRMASLRLAGATPGDVRQVAAAEAGGAALAGGLLAGPAYVLLWLVVGVLAPSGARMLTDPDLVDLAAWAAVVPLAAAAGALAGAAIHGRVVVEPLGVRRRGRVVRRGGFNVGAMLAGIALLCASAIALPSVTAHGALGLSLLVAAIVGLLLVAFAGGPGLVLAYVRQGARRPGVTRLLAARRLEADPRSAGRVAGVLLVCGFALAVELLLITELILESSIGGDDDAFYLTGYGMAAIVIAVAAAVAVLTLLVGAADGLLDARRPLATLAALGVDARMLERVVMRQLTATAVPAVAGGALLAVPATVVLGLFSSGEPWSILARVLVPAGLAAVGGALAMALAARLAARLLRPMIRAAVDPENLRVA